VRSKGPALQAVIRIIGSRTYWLVPQPRRLRAYFVGPLPSYKLSRAALNVTRAVENMRTCRLTRILRIHMHL
jgi:hypothetical protein